MLLTIFRPATCCLLVAALAPQVTAGEIHEAVKAGKTDLVRQLLAADPTLLQARDEFRRSAFAWAVASQGEELWRLLYSPSLLNEVDANSATPLILAIMNKKHPTAVSFLLGEGADPTLTGSSDKNSPLHWAAEHNRADAVGWLLNAGSRVEARNLAGSSALHVAAKFGHLEAVSALLERGAAVDAKNLGGVTALMLAASRGQTEVVRQLLTAGADRTIKDFRGKTAAQLAAEAGKKEVEVLLQGG